MGLDDISNEGVSNSKVLDKVVTTTAGKNAEPAEIQWVENNISSISEAVKTGNHDTLWYPASGVDILRAAFAYDATYSVGIDDGETIEQLKSRLEQGNFEYTLVEDNSERFIVTLQDGDKTKRITVLNADARLVSPSDLGQNQVDVLHIYLPTGATDTIKEIDKATGETIERGTPVESQISSRNLAVVKEGGFLCFGEKDLGPEPIPESLLKICGLQKHNIIRRHPHTISTSFYPDEEELKTMTKEGVIYQKVGTVDNRIGDLARESLMTMFWQTYPLEEFSRGRVEFLGIKADSNITVADIIKNKILNWRVDRSDFIEELREAGADPAVLVELEIECEKMISDKIRNIQSNMRAFVSEFEEVSKLYEAKEISGNEALGRLGVEESKQGGYESKKYPVAPVIAMGIGDTEFVERIVGEFIALDLDEILK